MTGIEPANDVSEDGKQFEGGLMGKVILLSTVRRYNRERFQIFIDDECTAFKFDISPSEAICLATDIFTAAKNLGILKEVPSRLERPDGARA
jgi:hypothetical protein